MKTAIAGTWHVHAGGYAETAKQYGEVIGVYDDNPEWRHRFAVEHGIPEFASFQDLLKSDAEGVIVNAATNAHTDYIIKIAQSGKKIFTEKVLALTVGDAERIRTAVKASGVEFVISYPQKSAAGPLTLKEIADSGELGELNYVRFRNCHNGSTAHWLPAHFYSKEQCGGGAMIGLGAHGMYLIDWLLGEPDTYRSVFTHACRDESDAQLNPDCVEDNAVTVMGYKNGAIAINETGFVTSGCPMTMEVGGMAGYAIFTDGKNTISIYSPKRSGEIPMNAPTDPPIVAFLKGVTPAGCGIDQAVALTRMMVGAYKNI